MLNYFSDFGSFLGPYVQNLSKHLVMDYGEIKSLMERGNAVRTTAATNMNDTSSRRWVYFYLSFNFNFLDLTDLMKLTILSIQSILSNISILPILDFVHIFCSTLDFVHSVEFVDSANFGDSV